MDAPIKFYIFKNWSMALYNLSVYDSYNYFFAIHNYTKHYFRKRNIMLLFILKRFSNISHKFISKMGYNVNRTY